MRNSVKDNLIYWAVCVRIEDHFLINDGRRKELLRFFFFPSMKLVNARVYEFAECC